MSTVKTPWEPVEVQFLREAWAEQMEIKTIAEKLERSVRSIEGKVHTLSLHRGKGRNRKHDHGRIRELISEGRPTNEIASEVGCHQSNVFYVRKLMKAGKP